MLALQPVDLPPILPLRDTKRELEPEMDLMSSGKEGVTPTRSKRVLGAVGHREGFSHQGNVVGERFHTILPQGTGMSDRTELYSHAIDSRGHSAKQQGTYHHHHPPLKLDFP